MVLPYKRVQYVAYLVFVAALSTYCYSFFSNQWYRVDYNTQLQDSFVDIKYYSEGLLSVCWFGDCVNLGYVLKHKSLKNIFVARLLMLLGLWIIGISFTVTIYKLHFTPDWYKNRYWFFIIGIADVFAGILICSATFYYLYFNELAIDRIGYFDFGCYSAWLSGTLFVIYGLLTLALASSVLLPCGINVTPQDSFPHVSSPQSGETTSRNTDLISPSLFHSAQFSWNPSSFASSNVFSPTAISSVNRSRSGVSNLE